MRITLEDLAQAINVINSGSLCRTGKRLKIASRNGTTALDVVRDDGISVTTTIAVGTKSEIYRILRAYLAIEEIRFN